ncbi:MAG: tRNA (adenosine(37)-N6)-dimethylallyltransferase MiaA [Candidatus Hydrogenedentes bacterium]|nr:tRNA (adenosine(37)-N6)-dimethylallyltransferase MiaA [Candidatus Hydrogenedentota bacterium]
MTSILAVVGPTGSGKTALAIEVARRLNTEIISADSMQVYRGMEIGTAAPTAEQLAAVKHHFVGVLEPDCEFSAGEFQRQARMVVDTLNARGKVAVVAGGSGLYVNALIDGLFDGPPKDDTIREELHREAESGAPLYEQLQSVDPEYAAIILPGDLRRIVRALEVYRLTGQPMSRLHREHRERTHAYSAVLVALDFPREELYRRINERVDAMVAAGFVEEVRALLERGYRSEVERLRSVGFREMAAYIDGKQTLAEAIETTKQQTRRFAKRQLTWFRADDRIHWLPVTGSSFTEAHVEQALRLLQDESASAR